MKKFFKSTTSIICAIVLTASLSFAQVIQPDPGEGGGGTQCTSSSTENTGTCKKKVDGSGDSCVTAGFWDWKNCNGQV